MIEALNKRPGVVFWQEPAEDASEPAILIRVYPGVLELMQSGRFIHINTDCVNEFIKALREATKQEE